MCVVSCDMPQRPSYLNVESALARAQKRTYLESEGYVDEEKLETSGLVLLEPPSRSYRIQWTVRRDLQAWGRGKPDYALVLEVLTPDDASDASFDPTLTTRASAEHKASRFAFAGMKALRRALAAGASDTDAITAAWEAMHAVDETYVFPSL